MKAVGFRQSLPVDNPAALLDVELPDPVPAGCDLLVEVLAVSVNPVDTKVRRSALPHPGELRVLGWDAAGLVRAVGPECRLFRPGDEVFYAGAIDRPGSNAQLQLVDERIVGRKPERLSFAEAAALPLTSITAWELLFDRLGIGRGEGGAGETLLVVGGAGGVGSMLIQLARRLTGLRVVATASRPESGEWCRRLGAHAVIDHSRPLPAQLEQGGLGPVRYVAGLTHTDRHFADYAALLAPQGRLALIDDPQSPPDIRLLKSKSISLHWEFMFTRPVYRTPDLIAQHQLLMAVADLIDAGRLRTTLAEVLGPIDAAHLRRAHAAIESGRTIGKLVLEGF